MAEILLVEPDAVLARTYQAALEQAGHHVYWRTDAQGSVDVLDEHSTDVIILELQLAQHNGIELLHEIRSYPEWNEVPVIVHTMLPPAPRARGQKFWRQLGIVEYLYKPHATLARLQQAVDQFLTV